MPKKGRAIYAGSFDPPTFGHLSVIERGAHIVDELIVAVARNISKTGLFTADERVDMLKEGTSHIKNIRIDTFEGLLVDYARDVDAAILLRGLRSVNDFQYEFQMALTNKDLYHEIDTIFLATEGKYAHVASSLIREVAMMGGSVKGMVPDFVAKRLTQKFSEKNGG